MTLDMVRLPSMGMPSAGTPVRVANPWAGDDLTPPRRLADRCSMLIPEDAVVMLTTDDGTRIERRVVGIIVEVKPNCSGTTEHSDPAKRLPCTHPDVHAGPHEYNPRSK